MLKLENFREGGGLKTGVLEGWEEGGGERESEMMPRERR